MSQLHISLPGFIKPAFSRHKSSSATRQGFSAHFPQSDEVVCDQSEVTDAPVNTVSASHSVAGCKPIELRIIQNGEIYRSKAEEARLIALGQWHHRRQRRRRRLTRRV